MYDNFQPTIYIAHVVILDYYRWPDLNSDFKIQLHSHYTAYKEARDRRAY